MLLAMLAQASRDFGEAERLVKEALKLGPDAEEQPKLLLLLGRTYVSSGRQEEGVATFEVIVQQFPQSPMAEKAKETLTDPAGEPQAAEGTGGAQPPDSSVQRVLKHRLVQRPDFVRFGRTDIFRSSPICPLW
jgi:tetratricopeptide (TPR) repeat protein